MHKRKTHTEGKLFSQAIDHLYWSNQIPSYWAIPTEEKTSQVLVLQKTFRRFPDLGWVQKRSLSKPVAPFLCWNVRKAFFIFGWRRPKIEESVGEVKMTTAKTEGRKKKRKKEKKGKRGESDGKGEWKAERERQERREREKEPKKERMNEWLAFSHWPGFMVHARTNPSVWRGTFFQSVPEKWQLHQREREGEIE